MARALIQGGAEGSPLPVGFPYIYTLRYNKLFSVDRNLRTWSVALHTSARVCGP